MFCSEGEHGVEMVVFPPGESLWASHSPAQLCPPVHFLDEFGGSAQGEFNFLFEAHEEDEL